MEIFSSMVLEIINREMRVIELRNELLKSKDYAIKGVLRALDLHGHGWVCGLDLFTFLKNYGYDVTMRQI